MYCLGSSHHCHQALLWHLQHTTNTKSSLNLIISVGNTITFLKKMFDCCCHFINVNINLWKDSTIKCLMVNMWGKSIFVTMANTPRYRPIKPGNSACCDIWHSSPEISPQRIARLGCSRSVNIARPPTATTSTIYPIKCTHDFLFRFHQVSVIYPQFSGLWTLYTILGMERIHYATELPDNFERSNHCIKVAWAPSFLK